MVERVARAMGEAADAWAAGEGCDEIDVLDADMLLEMAAVAITAMREPTEAMCRAATRNKRIADAIWCAMIDAALGDA
jgi:hypothetical protein